MNKYIIIGVLLIITMSISCMPTEVKRKIIISSSSPDSVLPDKMKLFYDMPTYTIAVINKSIAIDLDKGISKVVDLPVTDCWIRFDSSESNAGASLEKRDIIEGGEFILYDRTDNADTNILNPSIYKMKIDKP